MKYYLRQQHITVGVAYSRNIVTCTYLALNVLTVISDRTVTCMFKVCSFYYLMNNNY